MLNYIQFSFKIIYCLSTYQKWYIHKIEIDKCSLQSDFIKIDAKKYFFIFEKTNIMKINF